MVNDLYYLLVLLNVISLIICLYKRLGFHIIHMIAVSGQILYMQFSKSIEYPPVFDKAISEMKRLHSVSGGRQNYYNVNP